MCLCGFAYVFDFTVVLFSIYIEMVRFTCLKHFDSKCFYLPFRKNTNVLTNTNTPLCVFINFIYIYIYSNKANPSKMIDEKPFEAFLYAREIENFSIKSNEILMSMRTIKRCIGISFSSGFFFFLTFICAQPRKYSPNTAFCAK